MTNEIIRKIGEGYILKIEIIDSTNPEYNFIGNPNSTIYTPTIKGLKPAIVHSPNSWKRN